MSVPHVVGLWPVLVTNGVLGLPAYFISFLFAYGFRDVIGVAQHLTFLVLVAIFAVVSGLIGTAFSKSSGRRSFGVLVSLALNSAVVGAGSIVSAAHKAENSVSADFSTMTDVLVAAGLFVVAAVLATAAVRVNRRSRRGFGS